MISSSATKLRQSLLCVAIWLLCAGVMHADGRRVLAEKQAGVYRVVLFGNPSPLRAGLVVALMPLGILLYIWRGHPKKRCAP